MIFFAVAAPTPGSPSRSFWLAVFRFTGPAAGAAAAALAGAAKALPIGCSTNVTTTAETSSRVLQRNVFTGFVLSWQITLQDYLISAGRGARPLRPTSEDESKGVVASPSPREGGKGTEGLRGRSDGRRKDRRSQRRRTGRELARNSWRVLFSSGPSVGQRAAARLDRPRQQQQAGERREADPEERGQRGVERVGTARRDAADEDRADRGDQAADVVAEAGAGAAQAGGEQLRQVVGEAAEHPEHGQADQEVHGEARFRLQVEAERREDRRGRAGEIEKEHRLP